MKSNTCRQWEAIWQAARHQPYAPTYREVLHLSAPPEQDSEPIDTDVATMTRRSGEQNEASRSLEPHLWTRSDGYSSSRRRGGNAEPSSNASSNPVGRVGTRHSRANATFSQVESQASRALAIITPAEPTESRRKDRGSPENERSMSSSRSSDEDEIFQTLALEPNTTSASTKPYKLYSSHAKSHIIEYGSSTNPSLNKYGNDIFEVLSTWHPSQKGGDWDGQRKTKSKTPFWLHELHKLPFRR